MGDTSLHNNFNHTDEPVTLPNPHLMNAVGDMLFHLGIPLDDPEVMQGFSKVKFVFIGGTPNRLKKLAEKIRDELKLGDNPLDSPPNDKKNKFDFSFTSERFSGFRVGPVFCCNHGMGLPSVAILLHEVFKLLQAARCSDVTLIRIGTCGGVGVEPGTVVVSNGGLTAGFKEVYLTSILGQPVELPVLVDPEVVQELSNCAAADDPKDEIKIRVGKTFCAEDFYNGQGRLDGSFCDYNKEDKLNFLAKLRDMGVCNIEMESAAVLAMSHKVRIKAAVVCVVLVDRLLSDQVRLTPEQLRKVEHHPMDLVIRYIKKKINIS